jgi:hypothetical protein
VLLQIERVVDVGKRSDGEDGLLNHPHSYRPSPFGINKVPCVALRLVEARRQPVRIASPRALSFRHSCMPSTDTRHKLPYAGTASRWHNRGVARGLTNRKVLESCREIHGN